MKIIMSCVGCGCDYEEQLNVLQDLFYIKEVGNITKRKVKCIKCPVCEHENQLCEVKNEK